jgi:hypothetical protein
MHLLTLTTVFVCDFERQVGSELGGGGEVVDRGNRWQSRLVLLRPHAVLYLLYVEIIISTLYNWYISAQLNTPNVRERMGWCGCGGTKEGWCDLRSQVGTARGA